MAQYIEKSALLAEIERLVNNYDKALDYEAALEDVRDFLDSIEVKKSAEIERDKETCKENGDSLTQEPASNVWHDMSEEAENGRNIIIIDPKNFYGAVLRKGGSQLRNHNRKSYVKWAYIDDLQNFSNAERTVKNRNEPVSEELETFAKRESEAFAEREYEIDYIDRNALGKGYYWGCIDGAKWKKEQMMAKSIEAVVSQVPCSNEIIFYNPSSVDKYSLPQEMNKLGLNKGDKVKLIIIKQD